jgi:hypothetical protein
VGGFRAKCRVRLGVQELQNRLRTKMGMGDLLVRSLARNLKSLAAASGLEARSVPKTRSLIAFWVSQIRDVLRTHYDPLAVLEYRALREYAAAVDGSRSSPGRSFPSTPTLPHCRLLSSEVSCAHMGVNHGKNSLK